MRVAILFIFSMSLFACSGQGGGVAPSGEEPPPPPAAPPVAPPPVDVSAGSVLMNGETVTTANGWNVALDTTDPVENVTLANGWNVEVKYEF